MKRKIAELESKIASLQLKEIERTVDALDRRASKIKESLFGFGKEKKQGVEYIYKHLNRKEVVEKIVKKYVELYKKDTNTTIYSVVEAYIKGANLSSDQAVVKAAIKGLEKSGYLDKICDVLSGLSKDKSDRDDKRRKDKHEQEMDKTRQHWDKKEKDTGKDFDRFRNKQKEEERTEQDRVRKDKAPVNPFT